jgi:hypothetical protein
VSDFVVDASVVLTWRFPDENSSEATRILDLMKTPGNRSVVPAFFHQEVLNALLMGGEIVSALATLDFLRGSTPNLRGRLRSRALQAEEQVSRT